MNARAIGRYGRATAARIGALALLMAGGCRHAPAPPLAPAMHQVRYRLEWMADDVVKNPDGIGWSVRNDLGYRVRVMRGWVTSYSMELVECPPAAASSPAEQFSALLWSMVEGSAFAGHSAGTPNPAAIRPMQVESLTDPVTREVGVVTLPPQTYCKLHYLVARAGHDSPGLPTDLDMVDTSLHVDGTYRAPDATADSAFTVHTASAYGQLFERVASSAAALHVDTADGGTEVVIRRHLGRVFDAVDFAHMADRMIAQQILKSIVDHVEVEIVPINATE